MKISSNYLQNSNNSLFLSFGANAVRLHVVDGGVHGNTMMHFTKALLERKGLNPDVLQHKVAVVRDNPDLKQMGDLEGCLYNLNKERDSVVKDSDMVVIPGLATVPLLNLNDRVRDLLGRNISLKPNNINYNKDTLLQLLKKLYNEGFNRGMRPYKEIDEQIEYMDSAKQWIERTFGVIREINKMVARGVKVYIPAGHGNDQSVKWYAKQVNKNDELYQGISQPQKYGFKAKALEQEVSQRNWYDFNLLSLSDANVVNVDNYDGKPYIFSAKDDRVTDRERGVYNFTPVRAADNSVLGYSFFDDRYVDFPYYSFYNNEKLEYLNKFVGKSLRECIADENEIIKFKEYREKGLDTSKLPDKLYPIYRIYEQRYIDGNRLDFLGKYTDNREKLIFDTNDAGKVQFQKCNCEGSQRPSVYSMWGSCFSSIKAMVRDYPERYEDIENDYSNNKFKSLNTDYEISTRYVAK